MTGREDSADDGKASGLGSGRLLMVVVVGLAVAATAVLVLTNSAQWLRLGVLAALWAALIGVFLAAKYRRQVSDRESEAADLQSVYELELEREVAARREFELEVEAEARKKADEASRDDLLELRAELRALRENLERLTGGEVLVERFALRAQSTRMRTFGEGAAGAMPAAAGDDVRRSILAASTGQAALEPATELISRVDVRPEPSGSSGRRDARPVGYPAEPGRSSSARDGSMIIVPEPGGPGRPPRPGRPEPRTRVTQPVDPGDAADPLDAMDPLDSADPTDSAMESGIAARPGGDEPSARTQRPPRTQPRRQPPTQRQRPVDPPNERPGGPARERQRDQREPVRASRPVARDDGPDTVLARPVPSRSDDDRSRHVPQRRPERPEAAPLRAVPAEPATGGRRRAPEPPASRPATSSRRLEPVSRHGESSGAHEAVEPPGHDDPEATGAHAAGRSVTELLAAHGNQDSPRRHRRRAD